MLRNIRQRLSRDGSGPPSLGMWETLFDPLRSTSQERWFFNHCILRGYSWCDYSHAVVLSSFPGNGKSTSLQRVRYRLPFLLHWRSLFRRVEFYNATTVHQFLYPRTSRLLLKRLLSRFWQTAFVSSVCYFYYKCRSGKDKTLLDWKGLVVLASSILIVAFFNYFRLFVLILDDVATCEVARSQGESLTNLLSTLMSCYRHPYKNVVFVTSVEPLNELFDMDAMGNIFRMPLPSVAEMEARLLRMGIKPQLGVEQVRALYHNELALSAHFYQFADSTNMSFEKPCRADLVGLCEKVLLCSSMGAAVFGSHLVDIDTYKDFPIGGCVLSPDAYAMKVTRQFPSHFRLQGDITKEKYAMLGAVDFVKMAFPGVEKVPHRMVVPLVLAATTHYSNATAPNAEAELLSRLLKAMPPYHYPDFEYELELSQAKHKYNSFRCYCEMALLRRLVSERPSLLTVLDDHMRSSPMSSRRISRCMEELWSELEMVEGMQEEELADIKKRFDSMTQQTIMTYRESQFRY